MGRVFFKDSQLPQSLGKEHGPFRKYPYLKALGLVGGVQQVNLRAGKTWALQRR